MRGGFAKRCFAVASASPKYWDPIEYIVLRILEESCIQLFSDTQFLCGGCDFCTAEHQFGLKETSI